VTNAFKAYRKEVLDGIGIDTLEASGFDLTVEIPLKAHIRGGYQPDIILVGRYKYIKITW
jgi:hypothetical protein